ncbi:hypothetical protein HHL28_17280 [Aerophototrophica crusticola]|uniref:Fe2OG dioxygenase domain-containing protein n=1 Tax=Aerophototrophica crusticola TaxID=1709002 RepID=A0A858RBY0_9PROT|nr:hypothetical protein HHL28_17280 [Rhodospirillaceae bacterium B3]
MTGGGREALAAQGFVLVPGLLPPAHLAAWQAYADALVAAGLTEHSAKAADRDTYHGDPVGTLFLHLFRPAAEALAGRPLVPSYAFLSAYRAASALDEHLDRPPCEYTLSLHIDHRPRPDGPVPWPLRIRPGPDTAPVELRCRLGDGVVFRGRRLPHSRPRLPEGDRSTTLLLHYVHPDYRGPLD